MNQHWVTNQLIRRWHTSPPVMRLWTWHDIVRPGQPDHVQPGVPKYQQLAELIRQRILDGTYLTGEQLPPEVTLMQESGYSRDTVRAAVKVLRETGWVTVTHGLGTFVNPPELRTRCTRRPPRWAAG
jgi:DNA-binding transcriptional regulator YhcF (GntR family)